MDKARIAELRALIEAATPDDWLRWLEASTSFLRMQVKNGNAYAQRGIDVQDRIAVFIPVARTALPEALDEIERLREELRDCKAAFKVYAKFDYDTLPTKDAGKP